MIRSDLPADAAAAIAAVDARRVELADEDAELVLLRGQLIRELTGGGRGGKQRAAAALDVSWTQVQRALGEDVVRRVRAALAAWDRSDYTVRVVGDHAAVGLAVAMTEKLAAARLNAAYGLLNDLSASGLSCSADGMARDVGGQGPGQALVRGDEVTVTIA